MELKKVTCPNCGSSEITKINGEQYKCNYCNTTFLIDYKYRARKPLPMKPVVG